MVGGQEVVSSQQEFGAVDYFRWAVGVAKNVR